MKTTFIAVLIVLCLFAVPAASGETTNRVGDTSPFYWAQGRKVYLDRIADRYLALYESTNEKGTQSVQRLGAFLYRVVEPPAGIKLPGNAALMDRAAADSEVQPQAQASPWRRLLPSYREQNSGTMVLPTDTVIVRFDDTVDHKTALETMSAFGLEQPVESPYRPLQFRARCPESVDPLAVADALYGQPGVKFCHPDLFQEKRQLYVPNDPLFTYQWNLNNTGQDGALPGADIRAEQAWDITQGTVATTVAVVDSGIMWDHEDLIGNYVLGTNFENGTSDPSPDPGDYHGTACAGIAVGKGNNGKGISGVCPQCGFVAVHYGGLTSNDADMFYWQNTAGVDVSSNSWSYSSGVVPDVVYDAITYVTTNGRDGKGMIVAVAAGNEYGSILSTSMAAHPNVIAVGASTSNDLRALYSNFGPQLALTAPSSGGAVSISTTDVYPPLGAGYNSGGEAGDYADGRYTDTFSGTSAATPTVAGVAGLMLAANPNLTRAELTRGMLYTCDKIGNLAYTNGRNNLYGYGRVNAYKAVMAAQAADHTGWWYLDDAHSGTGISIEVQGLALFLAWYAYDSAGRPVWLTSDGTMQDDHTYSGSLYVWNGWPLGTAYYQPTRSYAGQIDIDFLANDQAQIRYNGIYSNAAFSGGAVYKKFLDAIVGGARDLRDIRGWWYDPAYNGMGIYMEAQAGTMFMAWYQYRGDTTGRWWSSGEEGGFPPQQTVYDGALDEFLNGQCYGCAYKQPSETTSPGEVAITFTGDANAAMSYNGTTYSLQRFLFGPMY